jgi:uncharacterized protein DUF4337
MEVEIESGEENKGASSKNKRIGLMIAFMAGCLAFSEMAARGAATDVIRETVEASDTWSFYQAKTIRAAMLRADARALQVQAPGAQGPQATQIADTVKEWEATAAREDSEPSTGEGRKELLAKAQRIEKHRDDRSAAAETYEYASGALELGILLASSAIVTGLTWLALAGGGIGAVGAVLALMGWFAPHVLGG